MTLILCVPIAVALFLAPEDKQLEKINEAIQSAANQYDEVLFGCHKVVRDNKKLVNYANDDIHHADIEVGRITASMTKTVGTQQDLSGKLEDAKFRRLKHQLFCEKMKSFHMDQLKILKTDIDLADSVKDLVACDAGQDITFIVCDDATTLLAKQAGHPTVSAERAALLEVIGGPVKCALGKDIRCGTLTDAVSALHGAAKDNAQLLRARLAAHIDFCKKQTSGMDESSVFNAFRLKNVGSDMAYHAVKNVEARSHQADMQQKRDVVEQQQTDKVSECKDRIADLIDQVENLKRQRAKLFKGIIHLDCEVSDWIPRGPCSTSCDGGNRTLIRHIIQTPVKGAACNALERVTMCNVDRCPQDCELDTWQPWTMCTSGCGGGTQKRERRVIHKPKYGGVVCKALVELQPCNMSPCHSDCVLGDKGPWGGCTRICGGGLRKRAYTIVTPVVGDGKCDVEPEWGPCKSISCPSKLRARQCRKQVDVVMVLDASGSLSDADFFNEIGFAKAFRNMFAQKSVAVVTYSDESEVVATFNDGDFDAQRLKRGTRLSQGLMKAQHLLSLGVDKRPSVVVYVIEAKGPDSVLTTKKSFELLKGYGVKVIGVLVGSRRQALWAREVATEPWQENLLVVDSFSKLDAWDAVVRACPST
eukprot:GEMP01021258.1.p1 GENE.GEMP01021258.1~~GEMP01021258.1.p1  ORF type:complete len:646 (+),score=134.82 GEMP01021258.1:288-2225(+)